jgi:hypothetical protein
MAPEETRTTFPVLAHKLGDVGGERGDAPGVEAFARARDLAASDLDHEPPHARQPAAGAHE